ncbi:hypothetical protein LIER_36171 [Lithospermum erythrorhizon]|uniref:Uncharacterized protein n=1 Tax=Lithospermum erythrorhizon TaxID=34254 RepID=A0AAV3P4M6_LITER
MLENSEHSGTEGGIGMHVPPTGDNTRKNIDSQQVEVKNMVVDTNPEKGSGDVEDVQPSVRDTSIETSYESAKTHSSVDPTVAEILAEMSKSKIGGVSGSRKKKRLRK